MKKIIPVFIVICLLLSACGSAAISQKAWNAEDLWSQITDSDDMPEMIIVPADRCEYLFGVLDEDCSQKIISICSNSLRADEIWLIEAKDEDAAARIEDLAQKRITQKASELREYAPEQYRVVQDAFLKRNGTHIVLIISPQADALAEIVK